MVQRQSTIGKLFFYEKYISTFYSWLDAISKNLNIENLAGIKILIWV